MMTTLHPRFWFSKAACAGQPDHVYWPENDPRTPPSEIRCPTCPVQQVCLEWALKNEEEGVWGGMTAAQRRSLNRPRHKVTCVGCGGESILAQSRSELCLTCGLSWPI